MRQLSEWTKKNLIKIFFPWKAFLFKIFSSFYAIWKWEMKSLNLKIHKTSHNTNINLKVSKNLKVLWKWAYIYIFDTFFNKITTNFILSYPITVLLMRNVHRTSRAGRGKKLSYLCGKASHKQSGGRQLSYLCGNASHKQSGKIQLSYLCGIGRHTSRAGIIRQRARVIISHL